MNIPFDNKTELGLNCISDEDKKKYRISGENYYNMMNFEKLEAPDNNENLFFVNRILNKTNNEIKETTIKNM